MGCICILCIKQVLDSFSISYLVSLQHSQKLLKCFHLSLLLTKSILILPSFYLSYLLDSRCILSSLCLISLLSFPVVFELFSPDSSSSFLPASALPSLYVSSSFPQICMIEGKINTYIYTYK